jgi:hypothetical protein
MTNSGRGTGRTTRMLEEVAKVSQEESITVVAATFRHGRQFHDFLKELGANMDNVHIALITDGPYALGSTANNRTIYYDHYALELLNG